VNDSPTGDALVDIRRLPQPLPSKIILASRLALGNFAPVVWNKAMKHAFDQLSHKAFSVIVCHDLHLLPIACKLRDLPHNKDRCKIVMDAREFYPRQREDSAWWRFFFAGLNDYLCKLYLPQVDLVFTVSPGLQRGYAEQYGVQCVVLPSYSAHAEIKPHATPASVVRCVHHGMASPGRKLEMMIEAIRLLGGRFHLDFMLVPSTPAHYLHRLRDLAGDIPHVRFLDPIPMSAIVSTIAAYDIGIYILPPSSFNHRHALPNKLFEYIQARLAVAIGPSPDMAALVREHGIGVVSPDFTPQSFAETLKQLRPEDVDAFKAKSHALAEKFCWERNVETITRTLQQLMI